MLDDKDPEVDREIAERVITNHRYQNTDGSNLLNFNYLNGDSVIEPELQKDKKANQLVYEKNMTKTTNGK
jgi:hypothetical protein